MRHRSPPSGGRGAAAARSLAQGCGLGDRGLADGADADIGGGAAGEKPLAGGRMARRQSCRVGATGCRIIHGAAAARAPRPIASRKARRGLIADRPRPAPRSVSRAAASSRRGMASGISLRSRRRKLVRISSASVTIALVTGKMPEHRCNFGECAHWPRRRPVDAHSSAGRSGHRPARGPRK